MTTITAVPTIPNQVQGGIIAAAWFDDELRAIACKRLKADNFIGEDRLLFSLMGLPNFSYLVTEDKLTESARRRIAETQAVIAGKPSKVEYNEWCDIVQRDYAARTLSAKFIEAAAALQPGCDPDKIATEVINSIIAVREERDDQPVVGSATAVQEAKGMLDQWQAGVKYLDGISTGFSNLDRQLGGIPRKHVITLAARPGKGKTQLALQIAVNHARRIKAEQRDACIVFFSAEMSKEELMIRLAQSMSGIPSEWLEEKYLDPTTKRKPDSADYDKFKAALNDLAGLDRYFRIDEIGSPSTSHMMQVIAAESATHKDGVDLVVFDYLALAGNPSGKNDNETTRIGKIMRGAKGIAKRYNCAFLMLAQLSREIERRESREPELSDLMGATDIEALSNQVVFIYRPDYYRLPDGKYPNNTLRERAESLKNKHANTLIKIGKNRRRQSQVAVLMHFTPEITRFAEPLDVTDKPIAVL